MIKLRSYLVIDCHSVLRNFAVRLLSIMSLYKDGLKAIFFDFVNLYTNCYSNFGGIFINFMAM